MKTGMRANPVRALLCAGVALVIGCASEPRTNIGYVGTWSVSTDWIQSAVEIVPDQASEYRARFRVRTNDGKRTTTCAWEGSCEERVDGRLTSRFKLRTWVDAETGHVFLESRRKILTPPERDEYQLDELVVSEDGLTLWAYSHERGGQSFAEGRRPRRSFSKESDYVIEPPPESGVGAR